MSVDDLHSWFREIIELHYPSLLKLVKEDCYKWFPNYSYSWWDVSLFKCYSIKDHDCDLYYERLSKNQW